jgi:hypothetical protein
MSGINPGPTARSNFSAVSEDPASIAEVKDPDV